MANAWQQGRTNAWTRRSGDPRPQLGKAPKLIEVVAGAEGSYLDVLRVVNEGIPSERNKTQT